MAQELEKIPATPRKDQDVDPAIRKSDVRAGTSGDSQGQSRARRLRRENHRAEKSGDHRAGARVRFRGRGDGGDHGRQDQGRRRADHPLRGSQGRPGMREMLAPTSAIIGKGLGESVGFITDGRFSGGTWGSVVATSRRKPTKAARSR